MSKANVKTSDTTTPEPTEAPKKKGRAKSPDIQMSKTEWAKIVKANELTSVSSQIRYLNAQNHARASIARFLNKRYQHVRNVLEQDLQAPATSEA